MDTETQPGGVDAVSVLVAIGVLVGAGWYAPGLGVALAPVLALALALQGFGVQRTGVLLASLWVGLCGLAVTVAATAPLMLFGALGAPWGLVGVAAALGMALWPIGRLLAESYEFADMADIDSTTNVAMWLGVAVGLVCGLLWCAGALWLGEGW